MIERSTQGNMKNLLLLFVTACGVDIDVGAPVDLGVEVTCSVVLTCTTHVEEWSETSCTTDRETYADEINLACIAHAEATGCAGECETICDEGNVQKVCTVHDGKP